MSRLWTQGEGWGQVDDGYSASIEFPAARGGTSLARSINDRLRSVERIGRELSERECSAIAAALEQMPVVRRHDVLDNYELLDTVGPDEYEGYDSEFFGTWGALVRDRHSIRLPNWAQTSEYVAQDLDGQARGLEQTFRDKADEIWVASDVSEGEFIAEEYDTPEERIDLADEYGDEWDGRIVALMPPNSSFGDVFDVEALRSERIRELGVMPGEREAIDFLSGYPLSELRDGSEALFTFGTMYPRRER